MKISKSGWLRYAFVLVVTGAIILVQGKPSLINPPPAPFTDEELQLVNDAGTEISLQMGQITLDPSACADALDRAQNAAGRVQPYTDRLAEIDADTFEYCYSEISKVTSIPDGLVWIESRCRQ